MQSTEFTPEQIAAQSYIIARVQPEQKVDGFTPCWIWQATIQANGYGSATPRLGSAAPHRISYMAFVGPIAPGLQADHLCYVRSCVNPDHLEPVTGRENMLRAIAHDKETNGGHWARREFCQTGEHRLDGENVRWITVRGRSCRTCVACQQRRQLDYYLAKTGKTADQIRDTRPKGKGSVYQRQSDGLWCGVVELPPVEGKRRRRVVTAKSQSLAEEKMAALQLKMSHEK